MSPELRHAPWGTCSPATRIGKLGYVYPEQGVSDVLHMRTCYTQDLMESGSSRIGYLDNLRILLTGLVVLHHTAITYGAPGSWYFYDTALTGVGQILLTVFVALNASFFMGFFFLLAGYFTPRSYDRKGPVRFLWDRLLRLGIPIAVYSFLIAPLIRAMLTVRVWNPGAAFWPTHATYLRDIQFSPGPLWFVLALLIFSAAYTVLGSVRRSSS